MKCIKGSNTGVIAVMSWMKVEIIIILEKLLECILIFPNFHSYWQLSEVDLRFACSFRVACLLHTIEVRFFNPLFCLASKKKAFDPDSVMSPITRPNITVAYFSGALHFLLRKIFAVIFLQSFCYSFFCATISDSAETKISTRSICTIFLTYVIFFVISSLY